MNNFNTIRLLMLLLVSNAFYAQNVVRNPGFEDGPDVCSVPNQYAYISLHYADYWINATPYTGTIRDNNATCSEGMFPNEAGLVPRSSAPEGNRAAIIFTEQWNDFREGNALGELTSALPAGQYKVGLSAYGMPRSNTSVFGYRQQRREPYDVNIIEIVLVSSSSGSVKKIAELNIPENDGYQQSQNYVKQFSITPLQAGLYDRVLVRTKQLNEFAIGSPYTESVIIDNLIIGPAALITTPADSNNNLAAFDNSSDIGIEPYAPPANNTDIWQSADIWNRKKVTTDNTTNQNPGYTTDATKFNVMRFRVRNLGTTTSKRSYAKLYWTMATTGETWSNNSLPYSPPIATAINAWDGSKCISTPNGCVAAGGELKKISYTYNSSTSPSREYVAGKGFPIPELQPGETYIIDAKWQPVNPDVFQRQDIIDNPEICFLGRITDYNDPMYGEFTTDTYNGNSSQQYHPFRDNIKNNNNIVTRNSTIVALQSGEGLLLRGTGSVFVENSLENAAAFNIRIREVSGHSTSFGDLANLHVKLDAQLWDKWIAGGAMADGIEVLNAENHEINISDVANAQLKNIFFEAGEIFPIRMSFGLNSETGEVADYHFTVSQHLSAAPDEEYGSVCNYMVSVNAPVEDEGAPICDGQCDDTAAPATSVFERIALSPNPAASDSALDITLREASNVSVVLVDTYGKQLKTIMKESNLEAGAHNIKFSTSGYADGIYFVVLKTEGETESVQLAIRH